MARNACPYPQRDASLPLAGSLEWSGERSAGEFGPCQEMVNKSEREKGRREEYMAMDEKGCTVAMVTCGGDEFCAQVEMRVYIKNEILQCMALDPSTMTESKEPRLNNDAR